MPKTTFGFAPKMVFYRKTTFGFTFKVFLCIIPYLVLLKKVFARNHLWFLTLEDGDRKVLAIDPSFISKGKRVYKANNVCAKLAYTSVA